MKTYQQLIAEKLKSKMEASQFEVPADYEEDANEFITKASAAHKAGKSHFTIGGKTYPVTVKKPIKTENAVMKAAAKRYPDLAAKQQDESIEEDMYSADVKTGLDGKQHPKHRINFKNSAKQKEKEDEKEDKKDMKESRAQKIISTAISRMKTQSNFASGQSRIPTPAERRAEMEKQKQMKKEEIDTGEYDARKTTPSSKEKDDDVFRKHRERVKAMMKEKEPSVKKEEVESIEEATPSGKQVKQAIGIARDKRYAGGNMTGATKVMDKINKGLAQHPAVKKELRKQNEEVDQKEYDYEGDMAKNQLNRIMMHSKHFIEMLQDETNLPEWVQSKITKAEDYISSAHDYMMGEMQKEEVELEEKMDLAKTDMGDVIKDFEKSDAPQFKGKSKEKKRQMAIAAKLGAEREAGMREEVDTGQYDARKTAPTSKEKNDDVFRKHRERMKAMKAKEASAKKEDFETPSFADFLKEYESKSGVYRHKGTYGTSYNSDDDDDAPKKPAAPAEKRGRGRPVGAKSGARQVGSVAKKRTGVDYSGYPLHLPNKNK